MASQAQAEASRHSADFLQHVFEKGADAVWILDRDGKVVKGGIVCDNQPENRTDAICVQPNVWGKYLRSLPSGVEIWAAGGRSYFGARVASSLEGQPDGFVVAAYRTTPDVLERLTTIQSDARVLSGKAGPARAKAADAPDSSFFYCAALVCSHVGGLVSRKAGHHPHPGSRGRHSGSFLRQL